MRRALLMLLACCSSAWAASAPERVPEHSLVVVQMETGERGTVFSADFSPVEVHHGTGGFAFTGPPGRYAILVVPDLPTDPIQTLFVKIEGATPPPVPPGPEPPTPPPTPEPTGFAAEVKIKAQAVGDQPNTARLGATFRNIQGKIGTDYATIQQVYDATKTATRALALPSAQWTAFNTWLSNQLSQRAQTMDAVRAAYEAIATGLEAAAR